MVNDAPSPLTLQVSCRLPDGKPALVVLARRTYDVDDAGRLTPAYEQPGLISAPIWDPDVPDVLLADHDLFTYKLRTDVVVQGHVHGDGERPRLLASVGVGRWRKRIQVIGERRCSLARTGHVLFSEPSPIDRVPLRYTHAYGGRDAVFEATHEHPLRNDPEFRGMSEAELDAASPWVYPRNPVGRGYLMEATADALESLALPLLESPEDMLSPGRLAVGPADHWVRMPLPSATDWVDYTWYPRIAFLGVVPTCQKFDAPPAEVALGLVPPALAAGDGARPPHSEFELGSGASLGLQLPHLRGGEPIVLDHMHPRMSCWRLTVPDAPQLAVDGRKGRLAPAPAVLHTLLIEPDRGKLTVVWRGLGPALRRYLPSELPNMPMQVLW